MPAAGPAATRTFTFAAHVAARYNGHTVDELEQQDIAAALGGDEAAYARLVARHQATVARLAWRFTRVPAECEELVQQTFVEAYFALDGYRGDAPLEHWLARIATRVGYRFWKERTRRGADVPLGDIDPAAPATDGPADPDPAVAAALVQALLANLAPAERLILTLLYFEECSTEEIARRMGWNRAVVKMRAYRARRRLKAVAQREHLLERLGWTS